MNHLGDITKISGLTAPIVDCIIGGSPCQGLSVAGAGKGLEDERSGLFTEQVRIAKEMRAQDVRNGRSGYDVRPRSMVWENVPGAFSSNGGEDFRVVLEELARVVEEGVTIPRPAKGKWATTGVIIGDGWSLAWRVVDAQYWGVPQRRRRICIVVDFNGHTAPQIVFSEGEHHGSTERGDSKPSIGYLGEESRSEVQPLCEGLSRNLEQSQPQREEASSNASGSLGAGDSEGKRHVGIDLYNTAIAGDVQASLGVNCGMSHGRNGVMAYTMQDREGKAGGCQRMPDKDNFNAVLQPIAIDMGGGKSSVDIHTDRSPTLTTTHYGEPAVVYDARGNGNGGVAPTMTGDHQNRITDYTGVIVSLDRASFNQGKNAKYDFEVSEEGINSPIVAKGPSAVCYGVKSVDARNCTENDVNGSLQSNSAHSLNGNNVVRVKYIVRRLTPLECERLQGFPDRWTDIGEYIDTKGKKCKTSDAARYKALGNSIALPSWKFILKRLCANYERDATMASLFDGISGFCVLWTQINGPNSVKWTSEIENFPIAVCKKHFGDEDTGEKGDFYEAILGRN